MTNSDSGVYKFTNPFKENNNVKYIIGKTYKDKGVYLGLTKGYHKFERFKNRNHFDRSPKYYFEKE